MRRVPKPPHGDTLEEAVDHYNTAFRQRYRLPAITLSWLRRDVPEVDALLADLETARADGVRDASCAVIARIVLSIVPRYAIGLLDETGRVTLLAPNKGDERSYRSHHVLLVNPLGGRDNWAGVARWLRHVDGDKARRTELAGLASEERPDWAANEVLLRHAASEHQRAIVMPPDEAFSTARAAEVSFIYGVPPETLRAWKRRYRRELAAGAPGAPRTKPVSRTPGP